MNLKPFLICVLLVFVFGLCGYSQAIQVKNDNGSPLTSQDDIIGKYARLLNVPKDSIKDVRLYTLIELYSGAPYKLGGNDANGIDCSGFSCIIEKMIYGITIPRSTGLQATSATPKAVAGLKEGNLVFLKLGGTTVNHVGVYLQNGFFVHATSNLGIVLDNLNDPDTQQHLVSVGTAK